MTNELYWVILQQISATAPKYTYQIIAMRDAQRLATIKRLLRPLIIIILILGILGGLYYFSQKNNSTNSRVITQNKGDVKTQKITLNQPFDLPVSKDNSLQPLKVTFTTAQLTTRISVSNKSKTAPKGTRFLMVNLLFENANSKRVNLKTRDILRLIDTSNKKFAPRYYNKSVAIEADAVKKDTLGFLVPDNIKTFNIQYGLPTGEKKIIELKFE